MRVERTVQRSPPPAAPDVSASSTLPLDQVTVYGRDAEPPILFSDSIVYDYTFSSTGRPLLARAVVAIGVLHRHTPNDYLYRYQGFWKAGLLFRILYPRAGDLCSRSSMKVPMHQPEEHRSKTITPKGAGTFWTFFYIVTGWDIEAEYQRLSAPLSEAETELQSSLND
ncbi:hypothetical protein K466DRAFT_594608 [Polyporus arcularius HHB13444]|uniref:Uncharacterized protein n=1 Tax=Polyporus arcularius HHB13444 TaxID=1314778 RepID=A0A5C3PWP0_9APHY|nr:hypothetical protein K466DRAFT_594608 [Polyporus arcularius HHB13444]